MRKTFYQLKIITGLFLLFLVPFKMMGQIGVLDVKEIAAIKKGTTYVAMADPDSATSQPFKDVFKKYWTLSKIEFIKTSDIEKHLAPNNSFFELTGVVNTYHDYSRESTGGGGNQSNPLNNKAGASPISIDRAPMSFSNTHIHLDFWTCNQTKSRNTKIGSIEIFPDAETVYYIESLPSLGFYGEGHLKNWSPGMLKNYLQHLEALLKAGKESSQFDGFVNKEKLKTLKNKTLYVPDYILEKFNALKGEENKKHDVNQLFGGYKFKYQIVSTEELDKKIMNDTIPFYYLVYVKSSAQKFISIYNSATGEVIYSNFQGISYNISSSDINAINAKVRAK